MYEQTLYRIVNNHIKPKLLSKNNRYNKWQYGYDREHDVVIISKTGKIGDIIEIQGLKIALPKQPKEITKFNSDKWEITPQPKDLQRIKTIFDWK